jgi:hypothetical protein
MGEPLLAGIRVVDLTTVVVGPAATLRLADYGAEIIKVEAPEGDLMRVIGGPSHSGELSGKFMHFNRSSVSPPQPEIRPHAESCRADCALRRFHFEHSPDTLKRPGLDAQTCMARRRT